MPELRLGFLASHGGSNLQAILDACRDGKLGAVPKVVISNNSDSKALQRARSAGLVARHLSSKTHPEASELDQAILSCLEEHGVNLVILAGYMRKLGPKTLGNFGGRILNIHPALLPKFGGQGMYGPAVHEAVLASGDKETGVTIHIVDEEYDRGPTVAQSRIPVLPGDDSASVAARVLVEEHRLYVETIRRIEVGEIDLGIH